MMIKVLGIAPYPGLRDLLKQVAAEVPEIEIDVETADLDEALPLSKRAEEEGYDVIISRGGTASLVRAHVSLPVVDISVSGYDILRVLTLIKDSNSKVAMVGFPNICQGAATVSNLLDFEIPIFSIAHESEVRNALQKAFANGAQLVLGDVVTVKTAQEMGYHGILVTSGRESVVDALGEVKQTYDLYRRGKEKVRFYERLLENQPQGVLVVEQQGTIRYLNPAAAQLIGVASGNEKGREVLQKWIGQPLEDVAQPISRLLTEMGQGGQGGQVDQYTRQENVQVEDHLLQIEIVTNETMGQQEYLMYLQPLGKQLNKQQNQRLTPTAKIERFATFAQFFGTSDALQKTIERAKTFASVDQHVWLSGPFGSKRSLFAQAIHSASSRSAEEFHSFHCKTAVKVQLETNQARAELQGHEWRPGQSAKQFGADHVTATNHLGSQLTNIQPGAASSVDTLPWSDVEAQLFGTDTTPGLLHTCTGTIYLVEIEHLPRHMQDKLLHLLQNGTPARLIVSSTTPLSELTALDFNEELALLLSQLHLKIPALSERVEDIDPIARVMIAEHNSQYGKQIVGLRTEVLDRLKQHTWPGNVIELENVLGEMLLLTKDHYVGTPEMEAVWERYELPQSSEYGIGGTAATNINPHHTPIDLTGNWEEIEKRILLQVLEEEGMNQSKAATRLGINRSTLWRKLRD